MTLTEVCPDCRGSGICPLTWLAKGLFEKCHGCHGKGSIKTKYELRCFDCGCQIQ